MAEEIAMSCYDRSWTALVTFDGFGIISYLDEHAVAPHITSGRLIPVLKEGRAGSI
jgi:hypothetical protein